MNSKQIEVFAKLMAEHETIAESKPGKIHRIGTGYYMLFQDGVLWEIDHMDNGEWIARSGDMYTDPERTLKDLRNVLQPEVE